MIRSQFQRPFQRRDGARNAACSLAAYRSDSLLTEIGSRRPRGYTLLELLVVCAISVLLMTVIIFIYANSLKVYRESHGMMEVLETAKILNRDLRDYLGNVVAIPGKWVTPVTQNFAGNSVIPGSAVIDPNYT